MIYRTKKRFGQHFLVDDAVINRILEAADVAADHRVLEIGPGMGALTDTLLQQAASVDVIEIDRDLVAHLKRRNEPNLHVHAGDVLQLDWSARLPRAPYTLVANLPYNISTQVVFKLLDHLPLFRQMVLMFQKEVGDRLLAQPSTREYGILSVLCRQWFDMTRVVRVPPGCFKPPPKVDSVVLKFVPLPGPRVPVKDHPLFVRTVKAAFNQRRKTLRNSLKLTGASSGEIDQALDAAEVDGQRRGETLSLPEFAAIADALHG